MILPGVAPCTAMVFVWSHLTDGNPNYTLVQVSVNDLVLVFAFAPIAGLLLGVTDLQVPWETLLASVAIFVVVPLAAGMATHRRLSRTGGAAAIERGLTRQPGRPCIRVDCNAPSGWPLGPAQVRVPGGAAAGDDAPVASAIRT